VGLQEAILVKEDPQNFLLEIVDSANSAISIYHEYLTIQYLLSLSLSLSLSVSVEKHCTSYLNVLWAFAISLSVDGAPEPQHNNIKACLQTVTDSRLGAKKCMYFIVSRCIEDITIPQNMVFPTSDSSRPCWVTTHV
jgi:hypothetical protein